ncbi:MAG: SDR family NAD(P)-dependent oxidoreductase [Gemmatimonadetes bacterium]|nr:SDR family NAD(P)-dependent oxidoreductase [Gemmatimonadota bacterium]
MGHRKWTAADIPDQTGRTALVTGANSGIGLETARELARAGASVIVACRDEGRGQAAAERIRGSVGAAARVEVVTLDLADLDSVRDCAALVAEGPPLDLLINNAGTMMGPAEETAQGFEKQLGVNHLGHFALTLRLLPRLTGEGARVVTVSSQAHRPGRLDLDDPHFRRRRYDRMAAYAQSKLANLLFTSALDRRLAAAEPAAAAGGGPAANPAPPSRPIAVAAHPGWTGSNLQQHVLLFRLLNPLLAMKPPQGALPTLFAATASGVNGNDYIGPDGMSEMRGYPTHVGRTAAARSDADAERLWSWSEEATGLKFPA